MKIRSLTDIEKQTIIKGLRELEPYKKGNNYQWSASIMLEDEANFIDRLLWIEKP
jgi:hypothetical protein